MCARLWYALRGLFVGPPPKLSRQLARCLRFRDSGGSTAPSRRSSVARRWGTPPSASSSALHRKSSGTAVGCLSTRCSRWGAGSSDASGCILRQGTSSPCAACRGRTRLASEGKQQKGTRRTRVTETRSCEGHVCRHTQNSARADTAHLWLCMFEFLCIPTRSWSETSVSHSATECEIISLDAGLRMDGLLGLDLWAVVIEVLRSTNNTERPIELAPGNWFGTGDHSSNNAKTKTPTSFVSGNRDGERSNPDVDQLSNVDCVPANTHSSQGESQFVQHDEFLDVLLQPF